MKRTERSKPVLWPDFTRAWQGGRVPYRSDPNPMPRIRLWGRRRG